MTLDELKKLISDQITSTVPDLVAGTLTKIMPDIITKTVTDAITKAIPPQFLQNAKDKKKEADGKNDDDGDETKKALAVANLPPELRKVFDDAETNAKLVTKFMQDQELAEFSKRAITLGLKKEDGVLMQKAYTGDKAAQKVWEDRLATVAKAAAGMEKTSVVFAEFGDNRGGREGGEVSAYDQLMELAKTLRKTNPDLTEAQAFAKVATDPANRELATAERDQRLAKVQGFRAS